MFHAFALKVYIYVYTLRINGFSARPCNPSHSVCVCFTSFILLFNLLPTNDSELPCHLDGYQTETHKIINGFFMKVPNGYKNIVIFKLLLWIVARRLWRENDLNEFYIIFCELNQSSVGNSSKKYPFYSVFFRHSTSMIHPSHGFNYNVGRSTAT